MLQTRWPHRRRPETPRVALAVAVLVLTAGGCAGGSEPLEGAGLSTRAPSPSVRPDLADADLWLSFEQPAEGYDGSPEYDDALGGPLGGRVVTANGGRVTPAPGADGSAGAVAFPARCTAPTGCPRAMVEVPPDRSIDPGDRPFEYGATVWLAPDQTSTGSNIVQRGRFGTTGGQWKLQVDSDAGEPSCVVRSGEDLVLVRSSVTVADSRWHRVVCSRDDQGVSIRVDGAVDRTPGRTGSVSSPLPLSIGSPGVGDQDDQFHGRVDDVFVRIDR